MNAHTVIGEARCVALLPAVEIRLARGVRHVLLQVAAHPLAQCMLIAC